MKCQNCGAEIQEQMKFCPKCGSRVEQPSVLKSPEAGSNFHDISNIWPEWQVEKQLGRGSYGVVYQAIRRDNNVESHAAIKIISVPSDPSEVDSLRSEGLNDEETKTYFKGIVEDFSSEIQLMELLKSVPNIVNVEDYKVVEKKDVLGWDIYIRMELLTSFNTYICDKTLSEKEIIKLGTDICTALEICSQRNVIHRDIKPENIFVNDFGYFKLGDFGIARKLENMTGGLSQKGTFNYMAPEVANSNEYDSRVDIYSLGLVLYRLLNNNKLPFLDTDKQFLNPNERKLAVERRIRGEDLPPPRNASPALAKLILRACAHNPNDRFASATEMKTALLSIGSGFEDIETESGLELDKTVSVRRATGSINQTDTKESKTQNSNKVYSFGDKKSSNAKTYFMGFLLAMAMILFGVAVYFAVEFFDNNDNNDNNNNNNNNNDNNNASSYVESSSTDTSSGVVYEESEPIDVSDDISSSSIDNQNIQNVTSKNIVGVSASSFLNETKSSIQHKADRVLDKKTTTAWVEGVSGQGYDEYITVHLDEVCYVSGITLWAGYHKSETLYEKNSRPKEIKITFSDGSYYYCALKDSMVEQTINFPETVATHSITITICDVYPGSKYEDTAITEISLF